MTFELALTLVALAAGLACALPGSILVARRSAMTSDAISHALLPAIVICFMLIGDLHSPLYLIACTLAGLGVVWLAEILEKSRRISAEAALGLVFPALFALGILLVSLQFSNVHIDVDAVLLGEIALTPLNPLVLADGTDLGPRALWTLGASFVLGLVAFVLARKELQLSLFDDTLARLGGFRPGLLKALSMGLVSFSAVTAFEAVGAVLLVALMIAPAAAARLLSRRFVPFVALSLLIGLIAAYSGFRLAWLTGAATSGMMALSAGLLFILVWLFAPQRGLIASIVRRRNRSREFRLDLILVHIAHHSGSPQAQTENDPRHLEAHLKWTAQRSTRLIRDLCSRSWVELRDNQMFVLAMGRKRLAQIAKDRPLPPPVLALIAVEKPA